jgi:hypothetical protein
MSDNPLCEYSVAPEVFEITTEYSKTLSISKTAIALDISEHQVVEILDKREAKRYIDAIFLEQGYLNRTKLNEVMENIIELKLEEMEETGLGSNKDILEILKLQHQMAMDYKKEAKEEAPGQQVNIQNNFGGDNYQKLMERIVTGDEPVSGI